MDRPRPANLTLRDQSRNSNVKIQQEKSTEDNLRLDKEKLAGQFSETLS